MKIRATFLLVPLIIANCSSSCKQQKKYNPNKNKPVMSLQSTYKMKVDEHLTLSLTSLSTAGYLWSYDIENKDIIEIKGVENLNSKPDDAVGRSADENFEVIGKNTGTTKVVFSQRRPWETDGASNSEKTITFTVE